MSEPTSPEVKRLLNNADQILDAARAMVSQNRPHSAIACFMLARDYVGAARAIQDMEDASKAYAEARYAGS
jgi:hypothetical protein